MYGLSAFLFLDQNPKNNLISKYPRSNSCTGAKALEVFNNKYMHGLITTIIKNKEDMLQA